MRHSLSPAGLAAAALCAALICAAERAAAQAVPPQTPTPRPDTTALLAAPTKPASTRGDFEVVALGDWMASKPVSRDPNPDFRKVVDIVRKGDVAVTNQEMMFLDPPTYGGYAPPLPANMLGDPSLARDEKGLGIDMVGLANNHAIDWGLEGLKSVAKALDDAGVVHAGYGETRKAAQAPSFFDTPKGRVALIAAASTFKPSSGAQDAVSGFPAKPGISTLRIREIEVITPDKMTHARALADAPDSRGDVILGDKSYREGPEGEFVYDVNAFDRHAILQAVREGKANADFAIFTIHAHENANDGGADSAHGYPARFLVDLFHETVDAGADVVSASGPHALRGIEIYKGKPIFYGLGVFIFRADVVSNQDSRTEQYIRAQPAPSAPPVSTLSYGPLGKRGVIGEDDWNDGLIATATFKGGKLKEVRLYPLDHQRAAPANARAPTRPATGAQAQYILTQLQKISRPFGTTIVIEGDVGVIRP